MSRSRNRNGFVLESLLKAHAKDVQGSCFDFNKFYTFHKIDFDCNFMKGHLAKKKYQGPEFCKISPKSHVLVKGFPFVVRPIFLYMWADLLILNHF